MKFEHISGPDEAVDILSTRLKQELESGKKVLWLITGGSNIPVGVKVMERLRSHSKNLTIMLTDERYGPVGHADSNAFQLKQAGLAEGDALFVQTLANTSFEDTIRYYDEAAAKAFAHADIVIAQIGMGADGHILGVLPHSPAAVTDKRWAIGYKGDDFTRLTLTPYATTQIDVAYLIVLSDGRKPMLEKLRDQEIDFKEQPAQLLKLVPEVHVCTNQLD